MKKINLVYSVLVTGLLTFTGCGSSNGNDSSSSSTSSSSSSSTSSSSSSTSSGSPHPGETATQAKARYLGNIKEIAYANEDINSTSQTINTNLLALAECVYSKDMTLQKDDIIATFGGGIYESDVNETIDCNSVTIMKVGGNFSASLSVVYYTVANPVTSNSQLVAYNYDDKRSYVVNTNVVIGNSQKVFFYSGELDNGKAKYTGKLYGLYLDPEQDSESRQGNGRFGPYSYNFYTDNALMKFNAQNPTQTEAFFSSSQIPSSIAGVSKIGSSYKIFENIVDPENSYVGLRAFDSLADAARRENEDNKTQANITFRVADKKAVLGRVLTVSKDSDTLMTSEIYMSEAAPFKPAAADGVYTLIKYNPALTTRTVIDSGKFFYATENDTHVYFFEEGSDQLWAHQKGSADSVAAVTGVTLAGNYTHEIHGATSIHGGSSNLGISGFATISGRNSHLGKGDDAYVSFHYDAQKNVVTNHAGYGTVYKSAQIFKLTATAGVKLMDNSDGTDESLANADPDDKIKGHVNLIAATNDKVYVEYGWWDGIDNVKDGNYSVGGDCNSTSLHYRSGEEKRTCTNVKYGYLNTAVSDATDIITLTVDGNNVEAKGLPYYVARRGAPFAINDELYVSHFSGGSKARGGYEYKKYTINLANATTIAGNGRIYFTKSAEAGLDGIYDGTGLAWDSIASTIHKGAGAGTVIVPDTATFDGNPQGSVYADLQGLPLAGVGTLGMLSNSSGNHHSTSFVINTESTGMDVLGSSVSWIYE